MKIIATTGQIGSGKDSVVNIMAKLLNAPQINISDIVRKEAKLRGISFERDPLTKYAEETIAKDPDYFVNKTIEAIKSVDSDYVVTAGIRSPENVNVLRQEFGNDFILIAVNVDIQTRYERIKKRGSEKDDVTYEEFLVDNEEQERIFQISDTVKMADYQIDNNGGLEELNKQVEKIVLELKSNE